MHFINLKDYRKNLIMIMEKIFWKTIHRVIRRNSVFLLVLFTLSSNAQIRIDSKNPHYFNYKNKPTILITSGEHYGAVINKAFDYKKYLKTLHKIGLNHTRIFLGDYVEKDSAFCINKNTLNPKENLICPWKRSNTKGYVLGGNKFDLNQWDTAYFTRLNNFLQCAEENDIVVEVVLFFASFTIENSPFYYKNNTNNIDVIRANQYLTLENGNLLKRQEQYCKKIVTEINKYNNVIYNIANEPWFDNQAYPGFSSPTTTATKKWIERVTEWIVTTEKKLPKKHILSVDYCNEGKVISKKDLNTYFKNISVFNHHYDKNAESLQLNYKSVNKVFAFNETGLMPPITPQYRIQGWKYIFNGGALYNNLDFTFQVGFEDGTGSSSFSCNWYNGCNDPTVKYELANLLKFVNTLNFIQMKPEKQVVIVNYGDENVYPLVNAGKQYAIYFEGGSKAKLMLSIPNGKYNLKWINPSDLRVISQKPIVINTGSINLLGPEYKEDVLLYIEAV